MKPWKRRGYKKEDEPRWNPKNYKFERDPISFTFVPPAQPSNVTKTPVAHGPVPVTQNVPTAHKLVNLADLGLQNLDLSQMAVINLDGIELQVMDADVYQMFM